MVTYCTSDDVANFLQTTNFSTGTIPTKDTVENMIERNEDYIDQYTQHSWRASSVEDEYIEPKVYEAGLGIRFDLKNRKIRELQSGTDKIEVWDGTNFVDYVSQKQEGFNKDYFVDRTNGVLYIEDKFFVHPKGVRLTYRYGDSTVAKDIERACILLTATDIVSQFDNTAVFADDGPSNRMSHDNRLNYWREEAMKILDSRKEIKVI